MFDSVADAYDRHRSPYPETLIDHACEVAGLRPGSVVLEIGCGTGQLTRSLLARDLRVTAVEPGAQLLDRARRRLQGAGEVEFVNARLEEAPLPSGRFQAVFSASAIHWIDPDVGWRRIAGALVGGGTLALLSYFGTQEPDGDDDQQAFRDALERVRPDLAAEWPTYRSVRHTLAGATERRANVSELWAWLGGYAIARAEAAQLFGPAELSVVPVRFEHTAEELDGVLGTMSFWARLTASQRAALCEANRALHERLGRPLRSSTVACLVTAGRKPRPA